MHATRRSVDGARHRRRVIGAVAAVGLLLGATWRADAADRKNYPATMCVQPGASRTVQYDNSGRVINQSASSVSLICPIVRDHSDEKWSHIVVRVVDRSSGAGNVVCQTRRIRATDGASAIVETQQTTGFSDAIQSLGFSTEPGSVGILDTYVLTCSLPPNNGNGPSSILSYGVEEND